MHTRRMPTMQPIPQLLTPSEVAAALKVDCSTVYRWMKSGALPCIRFAGTVRVRAQDFERLLDDTAHVLTRAGERT
jgi:excisionase family DNA binding protein